MIFMAICFTWLVTLVLIYAGGWITWNLWLKHELAAWQERRRRARMFRRPAKRIAKLWTD